VRPIKSGHKFSPGLKPTWSKTPTTGKMGRRDGARVARRIGKRLLLPIAGAQSDHNRSKRQRSRVHQCKFTERMTGCWLRKHPDRLCQKLVARLCPTTRPYELGTVAGFDYSSFNGGLADDVMDVMLTLATNTPPSHGAAPDKVRMRDDFPYFGQP